MPQGRYSFSPRCDAFSRTTAFQNPFNVNCSLSDFHNLTCIVTKLQRPPMPPKKIYYRRYWKFEESIFINDLDCIPTSVCDVFDDPDDKLWCKTKLVSNVVDSNAPIKRKVVKKPSVPFMNGNLRHAMHKRNMLYNEYKKGLATWRSYKSQRNLTTSVYKNSKSDYFRERCERGNKNQRFSKTIQPFMSNKGGLRNSKIILKNGHSIVSDDKEVYELFNEFFRALQAISVSVMTYPMITILIMDFCVFWRNMKITPVYVRFKYLKYRR